MNPSTSLAAPQLNNQAVGLLEQGLYLDAVAAFSKGLALVTETLALLDDEERAHGDCNNEDQSSNTPICRFHKMPAQKASPSCELEEDISNDPFVFRSPILLPSRSTESASSQAYFIKTAYIFLYNLALTNQISSLEATFSLQRMQKSLSLYELAYSFQMTQDVQLSVLETMALVNNLGQVHVALENHEKAARCFKHLLSICVLLNQNDYQERESVDQMEGFVSTIVPLILTTGSASAAAA